VPTGPAGSTEPAVELEEIPTTGFPGYLTENRAISLASPPVEVRADPVSGDAISERLEGRSLPPSVLAALVETEADTGDAETAFAEAESEAPRAFNPAVVVIPVETTNYGLSSWELTNALLQFHLTRASAESADNALAFAYGNAKGAVGMGFGTTPLVTDSTGLGQEARQLQVFSGLQEGLQSLGEVRIA